MTSTWPFILPLLAAFLYVTAVLCLKRASDVGVGLWESTFATNIAIAGLFQVVLLFGGQWQPVNMWWQPAVVAVLFLMGQTFTLYSLQKGDVSIATPVLGVKIVLVAIFTTLLISRGLPWQVWAAAVLATFGIVALNHPGAHKVGANATATIVSAGCAAMSFALFDVLVQKFSPAWGIGRFLPVMMIVMAVLSCGYLPFFSQSLLSLNRTAKKWLAVGSAILALQTVLFVSSIAYFQSAAPMNVIYSSRGLWSILAVAVLGHWFHSTEKGMSRQVLQWRLGGAALMFVAIILVLLRPN